MVAERQGQVAALNMLGVRDAIRVRRRSSGASTTTCRSTMSATPKSGTRIDIEGDVMKRDCVVRYKRGGRVLAVASIYRDKESLEAGVAMERRGRKAINVAD